MQYIPLDENRSLWTMFNPSSRTVSWALLRIQRGQWQYSLWLSVKGKGCAYSIAERRVPELIPILGSQHAGDVNHKPGRRLPLLSVRPAVTPAILKRAATNFAAW